MREIEADDAAVFGVLYYKLLNLCQETLHEMREQRVAAGRGRKSSLALTTGASPRWTSSSRTSARGRPGKSPSSSRAAWRAPAGSFALSELPYFRRGIDFLGLRADIRCYRDNLEVPIPALGERGIEDGIILRGPLDAPPAPPPGRPEHAPDGHGGPRGRRPGRLPHAG